MESVTLTGSFKALGLRVNCVKEALGQDEFDIFPILQCTVNTTGHNKTTLDLVGKISVILMCPILFLQFSNVV